MIRGSVNTRLEASLFVRVIGPGGQHQDIRATIDTGFTGALTLPIALVRALFLPARAPRLVTLGDGTQKVLDYYAADVFWDPQRRKLRVLCVEMDPLVGTALLKGSKLEVEFIDGGNVSVSRLP